MFCFLKRPITHRLLSKETVRGVTDESRSTEINFSPSLEADYEGKTVVFFGYESLVV